MEKKPLWRGPLTLLRRILLPRIPRTGAGWQIIKQTIHRAKTVGAPMTFDEACRFYRVTEQRLQDEIMPALRRWRRTATVCGWANLGLMFLGVALLHVSLIVLGVTVSTCCFVYAFKWQFRLWQAERRDLADISGFLADRQAFFQIFLW